MKTFSKLTKQIFLTLLLFALTLSYDENLRNTPFQKYDYK